MPHSTPRAVRLVVADSFRVRRIVDSAEVRGLAHHRARFVSTALEAGCTAPELERFLSSTARTLRDSGDSFPRLEVWQDDEGELTLSLSLRPLPRLESAVALVSAGPVALEHPTRKGPNIDLFTELRRTLGAEPLLTAPDGTVTEGATTALIWWTSETGHYAASTQRVASVAETLVRATADSFGEPLTPAGVNQEQLTRSEVWAVNALHGIRPVTSIDGRRLPAPNPVRLQRYRSAFDRTWEPVSNLSI